MASGDTQSGGGFRLEVELRMDGGLCGSYSLSNILETVPWMAACGWPVIRSELWTDSRSLAMRALPTAGHLARSDDEQAQGISFDGLPLLVCL